MITLLIISIIYCFYKSQYYSEYSIDLFWSGWWENMVYSDKYKYLSVMYMCMGFMCAIEVVILILE